MPDPVIQLACLDASLAMKPVLDKFQVRAATAPAIKPASTSAYHRKGSNTAELRWPELWTAEIICST